MHCTSIILIIQNFGINKIPKKGFRYPIDVSLKAKGSKNTELISFVAMYNSLLVTKINNKTMDITKIHNILKLAYHFTHASTTICNKFFFFSITPLIMR